MEIITKGVTLEYPCNLTCDKKDCNGELLNTSNTISEKDLDIPCPVCGEDILTLSTFEDMILSEQFHSKIMNDMEESRKAKMKELGYNEQDNPKLHIEVKVSEDTKNYIISGTDRQRMVMLKVLARLEEKNSNTKLADI